MSHSEIDSDAMFDLQFGTRRFAEPFSVAEVLDDLSDSCGWTTVDIRSLLAEALQNGQASRMFGSTEIKLTQKDLSSAPYIYPANRGLEPLVA